MAAFFAAFLSSALDGFFAALAGFFTAFFSAFAGAAFLASALVTFFSFLLLAIIYLLFYPVALILIQDF